MRLRGRDLVLYAAYVGLLVGWHHYLSSVFTPLPSPQLQLSPQPPPQHLNHSPPPPPKVAASPPPPPPPPLLEANAVSAKTTCDGLAHTEYDGSVMVPGSGPGATKVSSVAECCDLCAKTRGCNVWVGCTHTWCGNQCWLKWVEDPAHVKVRAKGDSVPWTSGTHMKDVPSLHPRPADAVLDAVRIVTLKTTQGDIRIKLKPEWHLPSVRFVQEAALSDSCTVKCELYRAEPGFLLQGAMRATVTPNKKCRYFRNGPEECTDPEERPGGSYMEKGDVAWAGGSAGPDFFIMMNRNGFGATHTVWGSMADDESMQLALKLVRSKSSAPPGQMRIIDDPIRFTMEAVRE